MKNCKQCGEAKPLSDYAKGKNNADGHRTVCLSCDKIYYAKYRLENSEKRKKYQDEWRAKNQEHQKAYSQKYYSENKDEVRAKQNEIRRKNPSYFVAYTANRKARKLSVGGKLTSGLSSRLFQLQKGKCACCKKPLGSDYHMDHIMPLALGGTNTDDNIQLLRAVCNRQKRAKHPVDFMRERGFLL